MQAFTYFIASLGIGLPSAAQPCLKAMSAFILAVFLEDRKAAQQLCLEASLIEACTQRSHFHCYSLQIALDQIRDRDPQVRQWACFLLAQVRHIHADQ
jgi:hypothetical protein